MKQAISVSQTSNEIAAVAGDISLKYKVEGIERPPLSDASFAVWHFLPWAMSRGIDLHVNGNICPLVKANAEESSRVWELWEPTKFKSIQVTGDGNDPQDIGDEHREPVLNFFPVV